MATYKHIAELIVKHRRNSLNEQEKKELEAWCDQSEENRLLLNRLKDQEYVANSLDELHSEPMTEDGGKLRHMFPSRKHRISVFIQYAVIVTGLLFSGLAVYSLINEKHIKRNAFIENRQEGTNNLVADAHRAQLKLANGRIVYLDSSVDGPIALQYRSAIYKRGDLIRYEWSTGDAHPELEYNTISTPRARMFTLELPDGSRAWLNASSSITYPTAFIGKERIVQITGEVYFEVNPVMVSLGTTTVKMPFIVTVDPIPGGKGAGARIEVMGTHFNVNAYGDEAVIKTTLLQGKVKVFNRYQQLQGGVSINNVQQPKVKAVVLAPGQQAQVNVDGQLNVIKYADIQEVMAWQKDLLIFNDLAIKQIMQQIARQYDYEVNFKESVDGHYTLSVPRQTGITQVLKALELSGGVHFEIAGKTIFVTR